MDDNLLHMLVDPRKCKEELSPVHSSNTDISYSSDNDSPNNYTQASNPLCQNNNKSPKYSEELKNLLHNLKNIDDYILNNQYNNDFEILQNYLIDLLFLIKSKKI